MNCFVLTDQEVIIYGDGEQTRSFCYMDDLLEAMIRTMNQEQTVGPVNIGNPNEFTIRELAEAVMKKVQSNASLIEMPLPEDDPTQRKPDITLAQEVLGWNPEIQLEEGLDRTIPYFQELLGV